METFRKIFEDSSSVKANGTTYKLKTQLNSKIDGYNYYNIIATPKDKSDIIVFKSPLHYVGRKGEYYLAMLGWTTGYDNGHAVRSQTTPDLSYKDYYVDSQIIKALEGKNPEYEDITYTFPYGTKMKDIKYQIN